MYGPSRADLRRMEWIKIAGDAMRGLLANQLASRELARDVEGKQGGPDFSEHVAGQAGVFADKLMNQADARHASGAFEPRLGEGRVPFHTSVPPSQQRKKWEADIKISPTETLVNTVTRDLVVLNALQSMTEERVNAFDVYKRIGGQRMNTELTGWFHSGANVLDVLDEIENGMVAVGCYRDKPESRQHVNPHALKRREAVTMKTNLAHFSFTDRVQHAAVELADLMDDYSVTDLEGYMQQTAMLTKDEKEWTTTTRNHEVAVALNAPGSKVERVPDSEVVSKYGQGSPNRYRLRKPKS